jgi:hypothetical protein
MAVSGERVLHLPFSRHAWLGIFGNQNKLVQAVQVVFLRLNQTLQIYLAFVQFVFMLWSWESSVRPNF